MATEFTQQIYDAVRQIPYGKVATYGLIAHMTGHPRGSRVVGYVMSRCQEEGLPCHRVVYRDGSLCHEDAFALPGLQRRLLEQEGVQFLNDGRVDLSVSLWDV